MHNVKLLRLEVLCEKYFLIHLAGKINNSCFSFVRSQKLIICFPVFWSQGNKVSSDLHSIYHVAHCTPPLWGPKLEFVVPILLQAVGWCDLLIQLAFSMRGIKPWSAGATDFSLQVMTEESESLSFQVQLTNLNKSHSSRVSQEGTYAMAALPLPTQMIPWWLYDSKQKKCFKSLWIV